jgi:hypothetical protein
MPITDLHKQVAVIALRAASGHGSRSPEATR